MPIIFYGGYSYIEIGRLDEYATPWNISVYGVARFEEVGEVVSSFCSSLSFYFYDSSFRLLIIINLVIGFLKIKI